MRAFANLRLHAAEDRGRRLERLTGVQPQRDDEPIVEPVERGLEKRLAAADQRFSAERYGDIERTPDLGAEEPGRCHADDRKRRAFDRHGHAENLRRSCEPALPQAVADYGGRAAGGASADIVLRRERAADDRRHAQRLEKIAADENALDRQRFTARGQVEAGCRPRERTAESLRAFLDLLPEDVTPPRLGRIGHPGVVGVT